MANWRELEAKVDQTTNRLFAERVKLSFMKNAVVDPDRPAVEINAILQCGGDDSFTIGTGFRTRLAAGKAELVIDRSSYLFFPPLGPPMPMPKKDDKVRALDRAGQPWFAVATVSDRYSNLLVLSLNQA